mmetsp:Transcript_11163/g.27315  ORF Transcript_11163/g.27315 Transcript_11163/m.27315 type:complete len:221 (-) Transcript_11163:30-692(-)
MFAVQTTSNSSLCSSTSSSTSSIRFACESWTHAWRLNGNSVLDSSRRSASDGAVEAVVVAGRAAVDEEKPDGGGGSPSLQPATGEVAGEVTERHAATSTTLRKDSCFTKAICSGVEAELEAAFESSGVETSCSLHPAAFSSLQPATKSRTGTLRVVSPAAASLRATTHRPLFRPSRAKFVTSTTTSTDVSTLPSSFPDNLTLARRPGGTPPDRSKNSAHP